MEKISELQSVKAAIRRHFKAGMATNCVLTDRDFIREIEAGALYTEESEGGLFILRDRGSHLILNYYVNSLPLPPLPETRLVCEITARGGENIRRDIVSALSELGFAEEKRRERLCRETGKPEENVPGDIEYSAAAANDLRGIEELFETSFDALTGCLTPERELIERIAAGEVFIARSGGKLAGAIETMNDKNYTSVRHLAVSEALRGRGIGAWLVRAYLFATDGKKSFVWTEPAKAAAYKTYLRCGYAEDGNVSVVMTKGRNQ